MASRVEVGSLILTPADAQALYQVARIGELRSRYRVGDTAIYRLLTAISECAFTAPVAEVGSLLRQEAACEEREWWTVQQVARSAGLSTRTVRLDCQRDELPSVKSGNGWIITNLDATTYISARSRN